MASRIIHNAIAKKIAGTYKIQDYDRFVLGVMLPDAYAENKGTKDSHLKISICGASKKTYDLEKFRMLFSNELKTDDLYRGYYLHLVQDLCFRDFVYNKYQWNSRIPGNVEKLHEDYKRVNAYVIEQYQIEKRLMIPEDFHKESINQLYSFGVEQLAMDFKSDFEEFEAGDYFFFTREMADEFITIAYEHSLKELESLDRGDIYTDMYQMAWKNKVHSLLETTLNTRDLGGYKTISETYTKWNSVIRSDIMKHASERDIALLRQKSILTIIDVRDEKDVLKSPNSLKTLDGLQYWNFPIEEGSGVPESTEEVANSYMRIAESQNISGVFKTIATAPQGVLFHCTAGKDRTGVIAAILFLLAGVSEDDIVWDYLVTRDCNAPRFELLHEKYPELDMQIVIPQDRYMRDFLKMFLQKYQTVRAYLKVLGLSEVDIERLLNKLI